MSSKAIKERPDKEHADWVPAREVAPSIVREDEPTVARWVGMTGLMMFLMGFALFVILRIRAASQGATALPGSAGSPWEGIFIILGLTGLVFHAARERDLQFRRAYWIGGLVWLALALLAVLVPVRESIFFGSTINSVEVRFLKFSVPCLAIGLLFLLPTTRNETDPTYQKAGMYTVGVLGAGLALTGFIGGNVTDNFLLPTGVLMCLLGVFYLWTFVGLKGIASDLGYWAAFGMGAAGLLAFVVAFGRAAIPKFWSARPEFQLVPSGLVLMGLGFLYFGLAAGLCSENRLVVMTRRELAAFFYSPIAYFVLVGLTIVAGYFFFDFVKSMVQSSERGQPPMIEPIVQRYAWGLFPVILMVFLVPILTMRLLSEERRTGTLEVLFTAPINEASVVLSKFIASLLFFLVAWSPWALFLVALRVGGGREFDYRPMLSFFIALTVMGSGFLSMGLFFSSLTRNQIISAVLTFVGMLLLLGFAVAKWTIESRSPDSAWVTVLGHISYPDLWFDSLRGKLTPKFMVFHVSAAIFWLFATVKVLEARKWW